MFFFSPWVKCSGEEHDRSLSKVSSPLKVWAAWESDISIRSGEAVKQSQENCPTSTRFWNGLVIVLGTAESEASVSPFTPRGRFGIIATGQSGEFRVVLIFFKVAKEAAGISKQRDFWKKETS